MITNRLGLAFLLVLALSTSAWAQGSIFGTVNNANASIPANGEISFVGYLDDTDEEIRIESCDGAGYDAGNWFDDFQNYLTEAPGNPYDYHFYNSANAEGLVLSGAIPNNSFQQENVVLAVVGWPVAPQGLTTTVVSESTILVTWTAVSGLTYHVYRRNGASNGSFFRIDDPSGSLANPGVAEGIFEDNTVDGVSTYDYLLIAEDPSGNLSPHSGVTAGNSGAADPPAVATIDPTVGTSVGGTLVNVYGSGFDPAGVQVSFGATAVAATVISPFHVTAVSPAGAVGSSVDISVTNTASGLSSNVLVGAYTYSANSSPVLAAIGPQNVVEGTLLTIATSASDPDLTIPIMTASALPGTATYVDNGDGTGLFDWTPTFTDAGSYTVTFYATDAVVSTAVDSEIVLITVTEAGNQSPIVSTINDTTIVEGQALALQFSATDPDNDPLGLAAANMPTGATFIDNGDGTGDFTFTPDFTQAGVYDVTFSATDTAFNISSIVVQITVTNVNQLPVLAAIGAQLTDENVLLSFPITATDADGVVPVLSTSVLPGTAVFTDSLNGVGLFEWTPSFSDAGSYSITFYAADADFPAEVDSEVVVITVNDSGNQAPILAAIGDQAVSEGGNLNLVITASDPDGTFPALRAENLPANATFADSLNGTGIFDFNPDFVQAGSYTVTFIADDGLMADSEAVVITVVDFGNVQPIIDSIGDFTVNEADSLFITMTATDPDGGGVFPTLSVSTSLVNYSFVDNGDGTGTLSYRPDYFDADIDTVYFFATDSGNPIQTAAMQSVVTTIEVNQPPVIDSLPPLAVLIGDSLFVTVTATDSTDPVTTNTVLLSALSLPLNASFVDNGDETGTFIFAPDASQEGVATASFLAVDQGTPPLSMTYDVSISVVLENEAPIIAPIGPRVTTEGEPLTINFSATDPDGPPPALSVSDEPEGSVFIDNGDGTGSLTFTVGFLGGQRLIGITFRAYDGITMSKELVLIQIYDAGNQAPVFDSIPAPTVIEGDTLVQSITAYDPDGSPLTLTLDESVVTLPANAEFADLGLGVGSITFYPDFTQAGLYDVSIVAWDGPEGDSTTLSDTITMTLTVAEFGNHVPEITQYPDLTVSEDSTLAFNISASDIDLDVLTLSTSPLPTNASFIDDGNGIGSFSFSPDFSQAGTYPVEFYASDGIDTDTMALSIEVIDNNRAPFIQAPDYSYTLYETDTVTLLVEAVDFDGPTPVLSAYLSGADTLGTNMTFVDNHDGTGTFTFIPDWDQGGSVSVPNQYFVLFRATDSVYTDVWQEDATVTFNVIDRNQPPELTFPPPGGPGPYTINEGETVTFYIGVVDEDAVTDPDLTALNVPATNATFIYDPPNRIGQFTFAPDFVQAGTYLITFVATDDRGDTASAVVLIDVLEAGNQPPSFEVNLPDTLMVPTGYDYEIAVTPYDPESDSITVEAFPMLPGAEFTELDDGTWIYSFIADSTTVGSVFEITFVVTDYPGLATDTLVTYPRIVSFLRGDLDSDNLYSVNDIAYLVEYLFRNGPEPAIIESADVNANGTVTISDLSYLIYYMYRRGPQPGP